ncbi:16S rRNA (uracil(1498)-N(3))-methyltransferase [Zhongshania sp.]|uniref:16S rRNA (uracil(1498)-N(3))-methyltransferase n=1 Tax=Zhongshania sp. TaxID=1971902 RepID=UPI00356A2177
MRVPRVYIDQPLSGGELSLDDRAAHYVGQVLRMRAGRDLVLFNGDGNAYSATIVEASKKHLLCRVDNTPQPTMPISPLKIELGIAISKGDRFDWVIQKATELGVTAITPLFTERVDVKLSAERLDKKQRHWQQIMISACEQCGRNDLVTMNTAQTLSQWRSSVNAALKLVLCPAVAGGVAAESIGDIALLVGPEGGLSENEINDCLAQEFTALQLGPRILRTETAPIAAISILQYRWGDMA